MRMLVSRYRQDDDELLDRPDIPIEEMERSLSDLEWTNRWLGGRRAVFSHIIPLIGRSSAFLDIGCGSADMLRGLADEGRKIGKKLHLVGVDLSPIVLSIAKSRCSDYPEISLVRSNATALPFATGSFDVVFSSTFLHHLGPEEAVSALREAARVARRRVVFSDLIRSNVGWIGVSIIGKFVFGRLSRYDGRVSFRRAYRPSELAHIAVQAGFKNYKIHVYGCYRMALVYDKETE